jgi:hypothetical protein
MIRASLVCHGGFAAMMWASPTCHPKGGALRMIITSIFSYLLGGETFVIVPLISVMVIIMILTVIIIKRSAQCCAARQRKINMMRAKLSLSEEIGRRALKEMLDDNVDINRTEEKDTINRKCDIYFAHDSLEGIGEYMTDNNLSKFLENVVTANHWSIVFNFDPYKRMICEPKFDNNDTIIRGVYRQLDAKDAEKFIMLFHIDTMTLSPSDVLQAAKTHPMNGTIYNAKNNLCQEWIVELSYQLGFQDFLFEIIKATRTKYYGVNILVEATKERMSKPGGNKKQIIRLEGIEPFKKVCFRFNPSKQL